MRRLPHAVCAYNPGVFGGGNIIYRSSKDSVCSPNITPDGTGIGTWDDATFIRIIRTGKAGMLNWVMLTAYRNTSDYVPVCNIRST